MTRAIKIVQIALSPGQLGEPEGLYALTDRGNVLFGVWGDDTPGEFSWTHILPQPSADLLRDFTQRVEQTHEQP